MLGTSGSFGTVEGKVVDVDDTVVLVVDAGVVEVCTAVLGVVVVVGDVEVVGVGVVVVLAGVVVVEDIIGDDVSLLTVLFLVVVDACVVLVTMTGITSVDFTGEVDANVVVVEALAVAGVVVV